MYRGMHIMYPGTPREYRIYQYGTLDFTPPLAFFVLFAVDLRALDERHSRRSKKSYE